MLISRVTPCKNSLYKCSTLLQPVLGVLLARIFLKKKCIKKVVPQLQPKVAQPILYPTG